MGNGSLRINPAHLILWLWMKAAVGGDNAGVAARSSSGLAMLR